MQKKIVVSSTFFSSLFVSIDDESPCRNLFQLVREKMNDLPVDFRLFYGGKVI
jgi:hypothetical protein